MLFRSQPGLAVVLVGDNPASQVYVRNKIKACEDNGIHSVFEKYDASLSEAELLARVDALNKDPKIHGILVQLPLPAHIDSHKVIEAIAAEKDVDGFHISNAGLLMTGQPLFRPCTPYGVMKMLESINYPVRGAHAVVVGASNIVGKPQAMLLLQAGATVTICNSKTRDLGHHTRDADILVVATGKRNIVTADMVKPGAVVIDVGDDAEFAAAVDDIDRRLGDEIDRWRELAAEPGVHLHLYGKRQARQGRMDLRQGRHPRAVLQESGCARLGPLVVGKDRRGVMGRLL